MEYDLKVDTALSYEGYFPEPTDACYAVQVQESCILVSSRYVGAVDHEAAASIAVDLYHELIDPWTDTDYHVTVWRATEPDEGMRVHFAVRKTEHGDWEVSRHFFADNTAN